ncbi:transmembrane protein 183 [Sitophilus oryzae]|uniref:Transmembrane protein 183 n=1 Tax=Sitophilus oryzae TaxID=7048 RepID=A0A6J2XD80_SITOR|nr:transmembrane protein 183 [Sitophilus oryzae]
MPPKKSSKKKSVKNLGDVTLNDFANSSIPKSRPKKSSSNVSIVVKQEVEKSWDAKDDEEFEGVFVAQENEDGTTSYIIQKRDTQVRKKTLSTSKECTVGNNFGRDYPIDIWYILSEYIRPEDVGTFASICKTSHEVVCSSRFWFGLYRRYYRSVSTMPEFLQPECLVRKYGLRANVIRALYYMYQPFIDRIIPVTTFEEHPESLNKFECHLLWHTMKNRTYTYYFKMRKRLIDIKVHSRSQPEQPDLLEILDDIFVNQDEYCRILKVSCLHQGLVPPVIGLKLTSVSLTLSSAPRFRYHRLQLGFGSGLNISSKANLVDAFVILDPVTNIQILDWWHPLYPCNHNMGSLLNQD